MTQSANPFLLPEDPFDNPFDTVVIGGEYMPGLASVGKPKRTFKWDKKEGPGTQGDSLTYRGSRLVDFVVDLTFWEAEQVDEWDAKSGGLEPDPKNIRALDIVHPTLERLKVRSIVVVEITELFHKGKGEWGVQIGVNEYKPPPKANASGTPKGSASSSGKDGAGAAAKAPTAKSEQEKEIDRLLKLAKEP